LSEHYFEFQGVTKSFGDNLVLDDVSFHVDPGETAIIMGRSGVGKSVSLNLLMGFLKADAGHVIVAGEDITHYTEEQLSPIRQRAAGNVAFPLESRKKFTPEEIDARVRELLEMLEVSNMGDRIPEDLSTGTKRAVAIARALAADPEAILYDEPTTMVDPLMAGHIIQMITKLKAKFQKTSIVVTHDTHLAQKLADRVIFLQEGKVGFFGNWAEFEASREPFLRNFRAQDELIPALDAKS
jgi:phospholipid/cholesterol/gamma-HCH transport system ATP-binding protein